MEKTFSNFNLMKKESKTITTFNDLEIEVITELDTKSKYDLIEISLQQAKEANGLYNEIKLDMFFHLNILYLYTDILFTPEDRADPFELYDIVSSTGLLDTVIQAIGMEYNEMFDILQIEKEKHSNSNLNLFGFLHDMLGSIGEQAEKAVEVLNNLDKDKLIEATEKLQIK